MASNRTRIVGAGLAAAAAIAAAATAGTAGAATAITVPQISSNWSGYAIAAPEGEPAVSFSDVTGTWTQPAAKCVPGRSTASAFWVGIGGFSDDSPALEQLGSQTDCSATGEPGYRLWYEIVPAASVTIHLRALPGDTLTAAVVVQGQQVTMSLKNLTRHTRFSKSLTIRHPLDTASAEWIAEAPAHCASSSCRILDLTNFGSIGFTNAAAIGDGHPGTIDDPAWAATPLELVSSRGLSRFGRDSNAGGAIPHDLSPDGRGFSVSFEPNLARPKDEPPAMPLG